MTPTRAELARRCNQFANSEQFKAEHSDGLALTYPRRAAAHKDAAAQHRRCAALLREAAATLTLTEAEIVGLRGALLWLRGHWGVSAEAQTKIDQALSAPSSVAREIVGRMEKMERALRKCRDAAATRYTQGAILACNDVESIVNDALASLSPGKSDG